MSQPADESKPKRRWWQFSLRTLLVVVTVAAGLLVLWRVYIEPYRQERQLIEQLKEHGHITTEADGPAWLRSIAGDDFCQRIVSAELYEPGLLESVKSLELSGKLPRGALRRRLIEFDLKRAKTSDTAMELLPAAPLLHTLTISEYAKVTDAGLAHLTNIKSLTDLTILGSTASDGGLRHVAELRQLEHLALSGTFADAGIAPLSGLRQLRFLALDSAHLTDAGLAALASLENLRELRLNGRFSDAGMVHLKTLKNLEVLVVSGDPAKSKFTRELGRPTAMALFEVPLLDVAEFLTHLHGIPIQVDVGGLKTEGVGPEDTLITTKLAGVPLREGLIRILRPLKLDWTMDAKGITITTQAAAAKRRPETTALRKSLPGLKKVEVEW